LQVKQTCTGGKKYYPAPSIRINMVQCDEQKK
jgi:hypothetical protein